MNILISAGIGCEMWECYCFRAVWEVVAEGNGICEENELFTGFPFNY